MIDGETMAVRREDRVSWIIDKTVFVYQIRRPDLPGRIWSIESTSRKDRNGGGLDGVEDG